MPTQSPKESTKPYKSAKHRVDGGKIKLLQWNCRSLTLPKAKEICKHHPDIIMLQEIWNPPSEALDIIGGQQELVKRADKHGSTLTAWSDGLMRTNKGPLLMNQDSAIMKNILADNRIGWIGFVYLNKGTKKYLLETFS